MSDDVTSRLALPLMSAGQAQKELTHNEAIVLLDLVAQPVVEAVGVNTPPSDAVAGQCWIVGTAPTGAWSGKARAVAGWTDGGWRFVAPIAGAVCWSIADDASARYLGGAWVTGVLSGTRVEIDGEKVIGVRQPAIPGPTGGTTSDVEARATLGEILAALRGHGLIAT